VALDQVAFCPAMRRAMSRIIATLIIVSEQVVRRS
jgi:hypothetical protein